MQVITNSPKVMELPLVGNRFLPQIVSGRRVVANEPYRAMSLLKYITARVLTMLEGDTRPSFVNAVQESNLVQLRTEAILEKLQKLKDKNKDKGKN